ncbi:hypothetical protein PSPO01_07943 [Paraphaeosphaeria sporulosa]
MTVQISGIRLSSRGTTPHHDPKTNSPMTQAHRSNFLIKTAAAQHDVRIFTTWEPVTPRTPSVLPRAPPPAIRAPPVQDRMMA